MENLNEEIRLRILNYLKGRKFGASSSEIAKNTGLNRITVTKYLEIMRAKGMLAFDNVAQAKLWHAIENSFKKSILIVDDEPHIVDLIKLSLGHEKYNLVGSYSGNDALERLKQHPDLMILDLMMPGLTGFEVLKIMKQDKATKNTKVLVLSAKGEIPDKVKAINLGCDDYMTKPFDPIELEGKVEYMLREDDSVNLVTKLPASKILEEKMHSMMKLKKEFFIHKIKIGSLGISAQQLRMMSKFLLHKTSSALLFHPQDNMFVLISEREYPDLAEYLTKMGPYLFHGKQACKITMEIEHKNCPKKIKPR